MKNKIKIIVSLVLTLALAISVCGISSGVVYAAQTKDYYVQMGGNGDGSSPESPAATVKDAIDKINDDGLASGDVANIYIMQRSDWSTYTSEVENEHGLTSWAATDEMPVAYTAEIIVQPYSGNAGETYLATGNIYAQKSTINLSGPTTIKNLIIVSTVSGYDVPGIRANGNRFKLIGSKEKIAQYAHMTGISPLSLQKRHSIQTFLGRTGSVTERVDVYYDEYYGSHGRQNSNCPEKIFLGNNGSGTEEYKEDYSLTLDLGSAGAPRIRIGNGYYQMTFRKNLNINVKSTEYLTIEKPNGKVVVEGAFQMIYPSSMKYESYQGSLNNPAIEIPDLSNMELKGGAYMLKNTSGDSDLIAFTETAGVYKVKSGYSATATDENGNAVVSKNGVLTLSNPGKYTVASLKEQNYYVQNGGNGDGSSPESPVATVKDAIDKVNNDGLVSGDVANIYIMQRADYKTYDAETKKHGLTSWAETGVTPDKHTAKIVVRPYSEDVKTYLATGNQCGVTSDMTLSGPTEICNLIITSTSDRQSALKICGNEFRAVGSKDSPQYAYMTGADGVLTLTDRQSIKTFLGNTGNVNEEVNIYYEQLFGSHERKNTDCKYTISLGANQYKRTEIYNKDYNLTLDIGNTGSPRIIFNNSGSDSTERSMTFKKNLNINIKSARDLTIQQAVSDFVVEGAFQMIYPANLAYSTYSGGYQEPGKEITEIFPALDGKIYLLKNSSGESDLLKFTETAGVYTVKEERYVIATDENGNKFSSKNGQLMLPTAGKYNIIASEKPYTNDYETITVNIDAPEIDFANEPVLQKAGYAFVGWKKADTDEFVTDTATLKTGDVLKAEYVEFANEDFVIKEIQLREENGIGLRYIIEQNKSAMDKLPGVKESGAISLATDTALGRDIYLDTPVVLEWDFDAEAKDDTFWPKTTGETPAKVVANNILEETETTRQYTVCVTDIDKDKYNTFYLVKGYIKYTDNNGADRVVYTEDDESSLYKVAKEALEAGEESAVCEEIVYYVDYIGINNAQKIARIGWNVYSSNTPPEQSIESYRLAYDHGIRIMLCDVRVTADNEFVCLHDATINNAARNKDGSIIEPTLAVKDITLAEANNYDYGIKKNTKYAGLKILTVNEFLKFCAEYNVMPHLELKVALTDLQITSLISLVKSYGFENNIMFNGDKNAMQKIGASLPNAILGKWVQKVSDNIVNEVASYGTTNPKFIYVSDGYESYINEELYLKCLKKGIDIGYTFIKSHEHLNTVREMKVLKYCKYVATYVEDLTK